MKTHPALKAIFLGHVMLFHQGVSGLVTLQTIRDITNTTEECRGKISEKDVDGEGMLHIGMDDMVRQSVLSTAHGDEDENDIEDTVSAALKILCSTLLVELEKPLDNTIPPSSPSAEDLRCRVIIRDYHQFLGATTKFLYEVQQRQMRWRWGSESPVFDGVSWLQGLWASRSTNSQERSFIEQQLAYYGPTGCFGKTQEVLRRDVEIVEYMNDLIDSFECMEYLTKN